MRARGDVEFRDVNFTYDADKGRVLSGISFRVAAGETVAIVGRSGSGKSTLVSLLPRFHDPDSGMVLLDGVDLREYRLRDLRNQLALVSQDVMLVDDSIRNNIAFSAPEAASSGRGTRRARGPRARFLGRASGGARYDDRRAGCAVVRRPAPAGRDCARPPEERAVLILDEATSALDAESEHAVQTALARLMKGRTTLVIAHRLATIERADRIVVLDEGRVVESGTHAALLSANGVYAALHRMQFNV